MTNLKMPKMDYANLRKLTGISGGWNKIANQTWARMADNATVEIKHHSTVIARVNPTYVEIDNGGYHSLTTANRLDRIVFANCGHHIGIKNFTMEVRYSNPASTAPVTRGMRLYTK